MLSPVQSSESEDEINSLVEFITDKCLDTTDQTPEDEDNDIPDGGKCESKTDETTFQEFVIVSMLYLGLQEIENAYINFYTCLQPNIYLDSFYLPPEFA